MSNLTIAQLIINEMRAHNYCNDFNINCTSKYIIITMVRNNHQISNTISADLCCNCGDPKYIIRLIIEDMIKKIGGITND